MSSSEIAVTIRGLSKAYTITHNALRRPTFRDVVMERVRHPFKRQDSETFWALRDVTLDVKQGEVLGVIGRNGAGKSTLLKILSRITEPTEGRVELFGRVGSLLEVGTGFHPELTGRENIYLNGAILGMTRAEIRKQFDAIVAFAEIDKFLDTPVKRYSSGMYVRLAFAVAAHLEPEILIVDEVLAVGDAAFQKRCLGKMGTVASEGRTVLYVSHNMGALRSLCPHCVLLDKGRAITQGDTQEVISLYLSGDSQDTGTTSPGEVVWPDDEMAPGNADFRLLSVRLIDPCGQPRDVFEIDKPIILETVYRTTRPLTGMRIGLSVLTLEGVVAFASTDHNVRTPYTSPGKHRSVCVIPGGLLNRRQYTIEINADVPGVKTLLQGQRTRFPTFTTAGVGQHGSFFPDAKWDGAVCPRLDWSVSEISE